jgi:hypothetical protein
MRERESVCVRLSTVSIISHIDREFLFGPSQSHRNSVRYRVHVSDPGGDPPIGYRE